MDTSEQLRAQAARYRKLAFLITDGQARDALVGLAETYEARAKREEGPSDPVEDRPSA